MRGKRSCRRAMIIPSSALRWLCLAIASFAIAASANGQWVRVDTSSNPVYALLSTNGGLFAAGSLLRRTTDVGKSWETLNVYPNPYYYGLLEFAGYVYYSNNQSSDYGTTWRK